MDIWPKSNTEFCRKLYTASTKKHGGGRIMLCCSRTTGKGIPLQQKILVEKAELKFEYGWVMQQDSDPKYNLEMEYKANWKLARNESFGGNMSKTRPEPSKRLW